MSFVVRPMTKLNIQFVDATIETPRERVLFGKISWARTQATGPDVC
jgi:hypothetical protein